MKSRAWAKDAIARPSVSGIGLKLRAQPMLTDCSSSSIGENAVSSAFGSSSAHRLAMRSAFPIRTEPPLSIVGPTRKIPDPTVERSVAVASERQRAGSALGSPPRSSPTRSRRLCNAGPIPHDFWLLATGAKDGLARKQVRRERVFAKLIAGIAAEIGAAFVSKNAVPRSELA